VSYHSIIKPTQLSNRLRDALPRARTGASKLTRFVCSPIYAFYEHLLAHQVARRPPPQHVGLILDGNRRYARREGLANNQTAYELGAQKLDEVIDWSVALGIPAVTLWVCSTQNLARPSQDVAGILTAIEWKIRSLLMDPAVHRHRIRVRAIGRLGLLPVSTQSCLKALTKSTASYEGLLLSIAIAYGGHEEITDAVRAALVELAPATKNAIELAQSISSEDIARHLYLAGAPEPDLIIRTSGELRLSGFLLWQSANSEFYFSDVLWPEFRRIDLLRAIRAFQQRKRRFGL
jgi:short-chain Z-isoprenyl diphosphate synthase